ncbi:MAG TPA: hypothetical protein VLS45_04935, partial [Methylomicrobium sp.]|nr:hypothetical protein [Methylomicrobium sp.]
MIGFAKSRSIVSHPASGGNVIKSILIDPKLSDCVDSHLVPLGFAVRMGRRNLFAGRRNGSRAAQI